MKKILLIIGILLVSNISFGNNVDSYQPEYVPKHLLAKKKDNRWQYVVNGEDEGYFIDKSFYKYDFKNNSISIWTKNVKKTLNNDGFYTSGKTLAKISCTDRTIQNISAVEYKEDESILKGYDQPHGPVSIFPDSVGEELWITSCSSKGNGFRFTKAQLQVIDPTDH